MKKLILTLAVVSGALFANAQNSCNNFVPVVSPDGQYLYFPSDRHGTNYEIYRSDLDGVSNLVRLTTSDVNNFSPSISPDGLKLVFQRGDYGSSAEIYMINTNGTGLTQLTNNSVYDGSPYFSPNGQKIVFDAWDASPYPEIFTMNTDGNNRTQLTQVSGAYWQCSPMYNPSGTFIYFSLGYNADNHLARMNLDGSNIIDITPANSFGYIEFGMHFNPDATKIIFSTSEWLGYNNGADLVIADTLGGNWTRITNAASGEWFYSPYWHPSNNKLYYSHSTSAAPKWQIYSMTAAGTGSMLLSNCIGVGVKEQAGVKSIFSFYPNPTAVELNINMPVNACAELYNATGNLVLCTRASNVNISSLHTGFYIIRCVSNDGSLLQTARFMKE
ncbi:MAG: PD40 domain-containing protein [Bacteroidia bacterium]|nr:PD40 domain-containing protein [Bacteroidia bacterium]